MSTVVFVHAHPDDEALLTGGTMAGLAARGHRVVLLTATDGAAGLAGGDLATGALAAVRRRELGRAAAALGCARSELLGYADSGSGETPEPGGFASRPVAEVAGRVAELLRQEAADAVVGYDPAGGYGHRDHQQVHRVVRAAAGLAGTSRVLEATVDRRALQRALRVAAPLTRGAADFRPARFADAYTAAAAITHCVTVRAGVTAKRHAMQAHLSQTTGGGDLRSLERFLRLPDPLFGLIFGREWFVEVGRPVPRRRLRDVLVPA